MFHPRLLLPLVLPVLLAAVGCGVSEEYTKAMKEGVRHFENRKWAEAEPRFKEALREEPDSAEALFYKARTCARLDRFSDAFGTYKKLLANGDFGEMETSRKAHTLSEMGALLLRLALDQGQTKYLFRALNFFNNSLAAVKNSYEALFGKAAALYGLEKFYSPDAKKDTAYKHFLSCTRLAPDRPEGHYFLGMCHAKDRRLSSLEAIRIFERGLKLYGDLKSLTPRAVPRSRVFETSIKAVDGEYCTRILRQLVPLMATVGPEKLKLEPAAARKKARTLHDAYVKLGGKDPMPAATVRWMEGTPTAPHTGPGPTPGNGTGTGTSPGTGLGPAGPSIRPVMVLVSPGKGAVRSSREEFPVEVTVTDDRKGATIQVWINDVEIHPRFDLRFYANVPFGKGKGTRTAAKFTAKLAPGANAFRLRASDTEGLNSKEIEFTVTYKPAALYALVVGAPGPGGAGALARDDARRFLDYMANQVKVPSANRLLVAGPSASPGTVKLAAGKIAAKLFEEDTVVFYLAGVGTTVDGPSGPVRGLAFDDFEGKADRGFLPLSFLGRALSRAKYRKLVVVLDASFRGKAGPGTRTAAGAPAPARASWAGRAAAAFGLPKTGPHVFLLASDGRGEAVELRSKNKRWVSGGLFTTFLLRAMGKGGADSDRNGVVTLAELKPYVADHVSYFSARLGSSQVPILAGDGKGGVFR